MPRRRHSTRSHRPRRPVLKGNAMTTELVKHGSTLTDQIEWTRLVTDGDRAGSILPEAYRGKPANVLIAVGLGSSMGLSPAESLYRISVIKGKPTAGAELIAANVRKAGHKLRVTTEPGTVTATILRSDDPDFPFTVTRDMAWAQRMGLAQNDNYKKQPETMLQWRAISAVARLACPEALYGVTYTPEEVETAPDATPARRSAADAFNPAPADSPPAMNDDAEAVEATVEPDEPRPLTAHTRRKMFALLAEVDPDATDDDQRKGMALVLGRPVDSRSSLTEDDAHAVIDALKAELTRREIAALAQGDAAQTGGE
jgi:hypothetical protein